tara:strand:- start:5557 stop:5778 length:222 start_codon:yes stop_codon:yes gene_type:complete
MKKTFSLILITIISIYQKIISPFLLPACRYNPTCSEYGKQAINKHGPIKGAVLTIKRIFKCHPWGGKGEDLVP